MKKTIIFDFDGVIADSFNMAFEISKIKRPTLTLESYKEKWRNNISKAIFTEPEIDIEFNFHDEYAKKMQSLKLSPEKKKVLQDLSKKYNFHIVSSTYTQTIEDFCKTNDIRQYFEEILGYDIEVSKVKKFKTLIEKYKLNASELIFITDTTGDVEEAREVGIGIIIAVADGYQDKEVLETANPNYLIDSIEKLGGVI